MTGLCAIANAASKRGWQIKQCGSKAQGPGADKSQTPIKGATALLFGPKSPDIADEFHNSSGKKR